MSLQYKLMIPLCDNRINHKYLTKEAGLLGTYTKDLNNPACDHHVILTYDFNLHTMLEIKRMEHFKALGYHPQKRKINGKWVLVYSLPYTDPILFRYKTLGCFFKDVETLRKIIKFWTIDDDDIASYSLDNPRFAPSDKFEENILSEEDCEDIKYGGVLMVQKNPQGL